MESYNLSSRKMFKNVKRKMFVQKLFKQKKTQTLQNVLQKRKKLTNMSINVNYLTMQSNITSWPRKE